METKKYSDYDCIELKNSLLSLKVTQSVGPRIISLTFNHGSNFFAEIPDFVTQHPDGTVFSFYGGHRLWHAPENIPRTYYPDDDPVEIRAIPNGVMVSPPIESQTGIQKALQIELDKRKARVVIQHILTNHNLWTVECAPWAITQLNPGGVALLPQSKTNSGLLPNRSLAIWPYTNIQEKNVEWGNQIILLKAAFKEGAFKIGFPNPRGWLGYWLDGNLFVKKAAFDSRAKYFDFNSSSQCYCNNHFLELETLAPISYLQPGESVTHTETWELYNDIEYPADEKSAEKIAGILNLG